MALTVLITLIAFVPTYAISSPDSPVDGEVSYRYDKIKTAEDAVEFLNQFGWELTAAPIEVKEVTIPAEFDKVFSAYNEIQKEQGLDLKRFKNKQVTRYTFSVENYPDYDGTVYATITFIVFFAASAATSIVALMLELLGYDAALGSMNQLPGVAERIKFFGGAWPLIGSLIIFACYKLIYNIGDDEMRKVSAAVKAMADEKEAKAMAQMEQ